ncbi:MAG: glycoside hydrolase family 3 N-terminal domain-containing protein [Coriobacteriia bacterium]|nr:glycoside hydrolase family 3 N-terminal domain-containing protein [Coriobacteriia bacterium]
MRLKDKQSGSVVTTQVGCQIVRQRDGKVLFACAAVLLAVAAALCAVLLVGCSGGGSPVASTAPNQQMQGANDKTPSNNIANTTITPLADQATQILSTMTLQQKVAQLFLLQPEDLTGVSQVVQAGEVSRQCFTDYPVCGLLFSYGNFESKQQTQDLLAGYQQISKSVTGLPLFTCVDEEGGTVARVADTSFFGVNNVGDMCDIGATGDPSQAAQAASYIASYLKDLGFNTDFAPDADVADVAGSDLAYRSFGADPNVVASMVSAQIKAFTAGGVLSCAKHFPGIGGALGDSHQQSIYTNKTISELMADELVPFQAAVEAGVPFIMVGHLTAENATGSTVPASLNKALITDVLRNQMGYDGLIITDSLGMAAVADLYDSYDIGVLALEAGNDLILTPVDFRAAYQGVLDAVESGRITEERIDQSVLRIIRTKLNSLG